jgi:hypothetical protein
MGEAMALKIRSILRGKRMADHTLEVPKYQGDVSNSQLVGGQADETVRVLAPLSVMTREQALIHAAWLVAMVDKTPDFQEFRGILKAVLET